MIFRQVISIIALGGVGYLGYELIKKNSKKWGWATIFFVAIGIMALLDESMLAEPSWLGFPILGLLIGGIGYALSSFRSYENCPKCDAKTYATKKLFFKSSKKEYSKPGFGVWISGLVGTGLVIFGISYLVVVGFTDLWLYALGMLFPGFSLLNSVYKNVMAFREKRKDLVETLEFVCPKCKHKWIRQE